jgi:hypothetical protein
MWRGRSTLSETSPLSFCHSHDLSDGEQTGADAEVLDECFHHTRLILDSMKLQEQRRVGRFVKLANDLRCALDLYQRPSAARSTGGLAMRRITLLGHSSLTCQARREGNPSTVNSIRSTGIPIDVDIIWPVSSFQSSSRTSHAIQILQVARLVTNTGRERTIVMMSVHVDNG